MTCMQKKMFLGVARLCIKTLVIIYYKYYFGYEMTRRWLRIDQNCKVTKRTGYEMTITQYFLT